MISMTDVNGRIGYTDIGIHITPLWLIKWIEEEYGRIDLDPATDEENWLDIPNYFTKKDDGLKQTWFGRVFVNPPYGRGLKEWVGKCYEEIKNTNEIFLLIPSRTDTRYWHDFIMNHADIIYFIRGRIKFRPSKKTAPFSSSLIYFSTQEDNTKIKSLKKKKTRTHTQSINDKIRKRIKKENDYTSLEDYS